MRDVGATGHRAAAPLVAGSEPVPPAPPLARYNPRACGKVGPDDVAWTEGCRLPQRSRSGGKGGPTATGHRRGRRLHGSRWTPRRQTNRTRAAGADGTQVLRKTGREKVRAQTFKREGPLRPAVLPRPGTGVVTHSTSPHAHIRCKRKSTVYDRFLR